VVVVVVTASLAETGIAARANPVSTTAA